MRIMTNYFPDAAANKPVVLSSDEIDELLSMTLIAKLATLDDDGSIHILPMWFLKLQLLFGCQHFIQTIICML